MHHIDPEDGAALLGVTSAAGVTGLAHRVESRSEVGGGGGGGGGGVGADFLATIFPARPVGEVAGEGSSSGESEVDNSDQDDEPRPVTPQL